MSQSFVLCCPATHRYVWVGQGWGAMTTFYTGQPHTMLALQDFLNTHAGHPLYFMTSEQMYALPDARDDEWQDVEDGNDG